ncbi:uncharacterized protein LOC126622516 [Malus sylvestris]|uniref:uncharacterized protein LOC126622516 n=1 Tax=Malus sylvestris TaxID=3752 RepID=UPI0021AD2930|nr:uncharacterized protein LOC126622516 [Malus sylvestris]
MAGKRKQIPHDSSSEASTDNPLIRVVAVIPSSNMVAAIISSSKYDIDLSLTHVSTYINNALQRCFVDVRHKLKKHFDSIPTLEEVKQNKHEDVTSQEELNFLCDHYASVQLKERSNKNAINRSHLTYNHKGGSKSFRAHEEEIEAKTEEQLSAIDYFEAVLKNTKNDWDKGAKLKWEEMLSMKTKQLFQMVL